MVLWIFPLFMGVLNASSCSSFPQLALAYIRSLFLLRLQFLCTIHIFFLSLTTAILDFFPAIHLLTHLRRESAARCDIVFCKPVPFIPYHVSSFSMVVSGHFNCRRFTVCYPTLTHPVVQPSFRVPDYRLSRRCHRVSNLNHLHELQVESYDSYRLRQPFCG